MNDTQSNVPRFLVSLGVATALLALLGIGVYGGYVYGRNSVTMPDAGAELPVAAVSAATATVLLTETPTVLPSVPPPTATTLPKTTPTATAELVVPLEVPSAAETIVPNLPDTGSEEPPLEELDLAIFYDIWELIEREYDGELPDSGDRLYGAISGSLDAIDDPYTRFLRPEIAQRLRDDLDGSVSGIGAIVQPGENGLVQIVRPIDNQPADLAGLLAGDLIVAIDGESVTGMSFDEVLLLVRGPAGSSVTLTVVRDDIEEPLEFQLTRAEFEVAVVESELLSAGDRTVAYVKLTSFTQSAAADVEEALRAMLAQNPEGIILDLRDNGGGFLDQAVQVADLFIPEAIVLFERSSASSELDETFRSDSGDAGESLPLVVLVNAGSASASEIVAGAVQDNDRGVLIGETTFGKGSVQHVHTLRDGSELRVTIARWFTPANRSISEQGIMPDIEVGTPSDLGGDNDTQLQRALQYLTEVE
jgi:carboxyl-terminal processing protease